jgi:hypothetical protein
MIKWKDADLMILVKFFLYFIAISLILIYLQEWFFPVEKILISI